MGLSKKNTVLVLSIFAFVSIAVGCGESKESNQPGRVSSNLPVGPGGDKPAIKLAADPNAPATTPADPNATVPADPNAPKNTDTKNLVTADLVKEQTAVEDKVKELQNGTAISRTELTVGKYTLVGVSSDYSYMDTQSGESLKAYEISAVNADTVTLTPGDSKAAGKMTKASDDGRTLDLPIKFEVKENWVPVRTEASNLSVVNKMESQKQTAFVLSDALANPISPTLKASVLDMLAGTETSDKSFLVKDEKDIAVNLHILKIDETKVRLLVTFTEKLASQDATLSATESITIMRNIYLDYTVEAAAVTAPAPAASDLPAGSTVSTDSTGGDVKLTTTVTN